MVANNCNILQQIAMYCRNYQAGYAPDWPCSPGAGSAPTRSDRSDCFASSSGFFQIATICSSPTVSSSFLAFLPTWKVKVEQYCTSLCNVLQHTSFYLTQLLESQGNWFGHWFACTCTEMCYWCALAEGYLYIYRHQRVKPGLSKRSQYPSLMYER